MTYNAPRPPPPYYTLNAFDLVQCGRLRLAHLKASARNAGKGAEEGKNI